MRLRVKAFNAGAWRRGSELFHSHLQSGFYHSPTGTCQGKKLYWRGAAKLVNDDDAILLDASSTVYYMALNLKERNRLRVVTNGIEVARLLAQNPSIQSSSLVASCTRMVHR